MRKQVIWYIDKVRLYQTFLFDFQDSAYKEINKIAVEFFPCTAYKLSPFTTTGALFSYPLNEQWSLSLGCGNSR